FLNNVCIKRPLKASPLPVSIAVIAFGTRKFCMIYAHDSFSVSPPNKDHSISLNGIETEPRLILTKMLRSNTTIRIINWRRYDLFTDNYFNGLKKNSV